MKTLFVLLSVLLALAALASAVADFRGLPQIKELMRRLQYRPGFERFLGLLKVIGAAGLLVGLAMHGLGVVAAIGFLLYFILALRAHRSIGDPIRASGPAAGLAVLSLATAITGLAS